MMKLLGQSAESPSDFARRSGAFYIADAFTTIQAKACDDQI